MGARLRAKCVSASRARHEAIASGGVLGMTGPAWLRRLLRGAAAPPRPSGDGTAAPAAAPSSREEREALLLRWNLKVLATEVARQRYAAGIAGHAAPLPDTPRRLPLSSRICRQADIEHEWLRHWCGQLRMVPMYHRKLWEDCFVLQALWEAGMLAPGHRALGFAVGKEWLPAYFAGKGIEVVATDLDEGDARARAWIETGQHAPGSDPLFQPHLVSEAEFARLVRHRAVDMAAIPAELKQGGFDFVWSVCSLEHLGTIERGLDFVLEAMRCVRPGGVAVHTTEYNLDTAGPTMERGATVLFQRRHLDRLAERLAAAGHRMLPLDGGAAMGEVLDRYVDLPPFPHDPSPFGPLDTPHLRLALEGYAATSVGIVVQAGGAEAAAG
jgi:SAM-dependent methyltransferase